MPPKRKNKSDAAPVAATAADPVAAATTTKGGKSKQQKKGTSVMASAAAQAASAHAIDPAAVPLISSHATSPTVYVDPATNEVLDLLLVQVELSTNTDKFYVLQLIYDTVIPSNFFVFTRWGRTGSKGQSTIEGPSSFTDASILFESKFHEKTGWTWQDRANFSAKPKKYNLMKVNHSQKALSSAQGAPAAKWEYYIDDNVDGKPNGWYEYAKEGAENTEDLWTVYQSNNLYTQRIVDSGHFQYLVDLVKMTQRNVSVSNGKTRMIRRTANGVVTCASFAPSSSPLPSKAPSHPPQPTPTAAAHLASVSKGHPVYPSSTSSASASASASTTLSFPSSPAPAPAKAVGKVTTPSKAASQPASKPVDTDCTLGTAGVSVLEDYDAMLNQVDLGKNANKFYRVQLLTKNNTFYVWTKWGRVGDSFIPSQSALIGPSSKEQAIADFDKKFKDKSGNKWEDRASFVAKKGKYELIAMADGDEEDEDDEDDEEVVSPVKAVQPSGPVPPSALPPQTQDLVSFIFDQDMFKSAMKELNIDLKRMPLGKLSSKQVDKGFAVLEQIKAILNTSAKGKKASASTAELQSLSGNFYQVVPHSFKRNEKPPIIDTVDKLVEKFDMLNTLNDISTAQGLMSAGPAGSINPIDRNYRELKADLDLLTPHSNSTHAEYFQAIQNYIAATKGYHGINLDQVWEVRRHPEDACFASFNALDNHFLLWHGTNVAVVAAILKTGLRIMPAVNGGRVGRGIYMANELSKSASYVKPSYNPAGARIGILFLVQAALGDMHVIYNDDPSLTSAPAGFNSVLAKGTRSPYGGSTVTLNLDGKPVSVPQSAPSATNVKSSFSQDEFLVYEEAQQRLRFILTFRY